MLRKFFTTVAAGSLFVGGLTASHIAFAQPDGAEGPGRHGARGGMMMKAYADKDGTLTKAALTAALEARFARMDVDKDGTLTQADRDAMRAQRLDARFAALDTDKDGQISKAEFTARPAPAQPDGARAEKPGGRDGRHWGGRHHHGPGKGMATGGWRGGAGKDGVLTKAEFMAGPIALFDKADADKDGKVTAEEMKAARDAMRQQWRERKGRPAQPAG
ncbi:MAG: EF-hand domain-containing protein [Sphingobium sp.]